MREDSIFAKAHANDFKPKPATDDNALVLKIVEWLKSGSKSQKTLGGVACLQPFFPNQPTQYSPPGHMMQVILEFRNRAPAQQIMPTRNDRVLVTYGAAHLPGLAAKLRKNDPKWVIDSVKWLHTI